jgi:hypothetical protein
MSGGTSFMIRGNNKNLVLILQGSSQFIQPVCLYTVIVAD